MLRKKTIWGLMCAVLLMLFFAVPASAATASPPAKTYSGGTWKYVKGQKYYRVKKKNITGWAKIAKKTYYFRKNGTLYTGWKDYKGRSYYFEPRNQSGAMVTNGFYTSEDGKLYYFSKTGASAKGTFSLGSGSAKKYYYARKGNHALAQRMWSNAVGGQWYYFDSKGVRHNKWFTINGRTYYCSPTKGKLSGWNVISGDYYYFNDKGYVEVSQWLAGKNDGELWYVGETGAVEKRALNDSSVSRDYGDIIMVGDSRFYHTYARYGITAENVTFIAKPKMGYDWLVSSAYPVIENQVKADYERRQAQMDPSVEESAAESVFGRTAIVLNLGVNDLSNIERYLAYANGTLKRLADQYDCDLYYVSINPVSAKKFSANNTKRNDKLIREFNNALKTRLDPAYTYIDTYSYLTKRYGSDYSTITVSDGLHYDAVISRVIFNRIMSELIPKKSQIIPINRILHCRILFLSS